MRAAGPHGSDVLFLTQHYRPEMIGSAPFCTELAEWLAAQGQKVTVLTGRPTYPLAEAFPSYVKDCPSVEELGGVRVERLRHWSPQRRTNVMRMIGEGMFLANGLWALLTRRIGRSDLVLSLCPSILTSALGVLARRRGGQHVAIVHDIQSGLASGLGMVANPNILRLMRWLERAVLNQTDLIGVLSDDMAAQLRKLGITKPIIVMPLWVDIDRISVAAPAPSLQTTVLYSGNLGKKQGLGQVLDLAEELRARNSDIKILLRGSGSEYGFLKSEVARRSLSNVGMADLLPDGKLDAGLAEGEIHLVPQDPKAAAFAVPSKVFNIMAAGRPFVATAAPDTALGQLRAKSGAFICVAPNDRVAFADTIVHLANNVNLRTELGRRGRSYVEAFHSKRQILSQFGSMLNKLGGHG